MAFSYSNKEIAELLRQIAAVYQIKKKNIFQIRAYETAADSVEHSTSDLKTLWEEGKLDDVPGLGESLRSYLDELFKTGKVKHFEEVSKGIDKNVFEFLNIPGVGPSTALKIAKEGVSSIVELEDLIRDGELSTKQISEKIQKNILAGIGELNRKSDRILLPVAQETAEKIITYLLSHPKVKRADTLGSLRRKVSTVGDIDISVASEAAQEVVRHFCEYSGVDRVVEAGDKTATVALHNGLRVDLMVQSPDFYGNLLQHFTGGKNHNIKIRSWAQKKGYSISDNGLKEVKTGKIHKFQDEEEVYSFLKLQFPAPELREDTGELEAAIKHTLPKLIELKDIKGDLHTHSNYTDGKNSIEEMVIAAQKLGRDYIALTDHSYPNLDYKKRIEDIEQINYSNNNIRVIKGLEVNINIDATLQISDYVLAKHEFVLVSIHTGFRQDSTTMTKRILNALQNKYVHALAHPTGRLLLEREGISADWSKIFKFAADNGKVLEINSFPNRSDLPDQLVKEAKKYRVKFSIDTDSHHTDHLNLMEYGIAIAKRGWLEANEVINTLPYRKLKDIISSLK